MKVIVKKHTDIEEAHACIESTMAPDFVAKATLKDIYSWEHSVTRSQLFSVQLIDVFSFVSVHLCRHVTTVPFVRSMRVDRGGNGEESRYTLVNHRFLANAEALMNMARRRLCFQASVETREAMLMIKKAMIDVDPDLAHFMVPNCVYRGGYCPEPRPCGRYKVKKYNPAKILEEIME